jgi:hypothetical protein
MFVSSCSKEVSLAGAEIFYTLSREESSCALLAKRVLLLRKLLDHIQAFVSSELEEDEEFAKRCALTLVNLSKAGDHRKFLVCLEPSIANTSASTQHAVLSPLLFNLLSNISTI